MDTSKIKAAAYTVLMGVLAAAAQGAIGYLAGLDWTQFGVPAGVAGVLGAGLLAMRSPFRR